MTSKEALEIITHPFTCCHYGEKHKEASEVIKKDLEILEILKLCGETRPNELLIYLSDRTDADIGNGMAEYEAFTKVKEWLDNE